MSNDILKADEVSKHTLTLPSSVYAALKLSAEQQGLEPNDVIQDLVIEHVIRAGTLDKGTQAQLEAYKWLVTHTVEVAKRRLRDGEEVETLTKDTFAACAADPEWASKYRFYVQDDIFKTGNPRKGTINREIGARIRSAVGAEVKKDNTDRPLSEKVTGSVIQSYTPFASFDPSKL